MVTELEIEQMLSFSAASQFSIALNAANELLSRVEDEVQRMVVLYEIITCSAWLGLPEQTEAAVQALRVLVGPEIPDVWLAMTRAQMDVEAGRANEALALINENLESEFMHTEGYKDWLYDQLVLKANALTRLDRYGEALAALSKADELLPGGRCEADILVNRANCLIAMHDYENAFLAAKAATTKGDDDFAVFGMFQMAECRMRQRRISEALALYLQVEKQLPTKFVDADGLRTEIARATAILEKRSPQTSPF